MRKNLLRLLLILLVFLISYPVQFAAASSLKSVQQDNGSEQVKATSFIQAAGIIAQLPVMPAAYQGLIKSLWPGKLNRPALSFSLICTTLFLQNKAFAVHRLTHVQQLLFPAHYFW